MFAHQLFAHQALATERIPAYLKLQFLIAAWGQCWLGKLQPRTKSISHADCFHSHPLAPSLGGRLGSDLVDYRSCSSTSLNHTSSKIAWLNPKNGRGRMVRHSRKDRRNSSHWARRVKSDAKTSRCARSHATAMAEQRNPVFFWT